MSESESVPSLDKVVSDKEDIKDDLQSARDQSARDQSARGRQGRGRGAGGGRGAGRGGRHDEGKPPPGPARGRRPVKLQVRREDGLFDPLGLPIKHLAVDGLCYAPICQEEFVKNKNLFTPRQDDVMVATYPRSGTTWTLEIIRNIHLVQNQDLETSHPLKTQNHHVSAPWINTFKMSDAEPSPRIMKTHNHYQHLNLPEDNKDFKIIHVMRDPKDVLCSAYHHIIKAGHLFGYQGTLPEFVSYFLAGRVESGDYWDFNGAYLENKCGFNILYLKYEELTKDKLECIKKINHFLGYSTISAEQLEAVDGPTRFEAMCGTQVPVSNVGKVKGEVGQSKVMLSEAERRVVVEHTEKKFAGFEEIPSSYLTD